MKPLEVMQCKECLKWHIKIDENECACCRGSPKIRQTVCCMDGCNNPAERNAQISVEAPNEVNIEAAVQAVGRLFEAMFHIYGPMCSDCIEEYLNDAHNTGAMEQLIHACASEIVAEQFREDWA